MRSSSQSLAQFIPQQDRDMLLYVHSGKDQTSKAMNLWKIKEYHPAYAVVLG